MRLATAHDTFSPVALSMIVTIAVSATAMTGAPTTTPSSIVVLSVDRRPAPSAPILAVAAVPSCALDEELAARSRDERTLVRLWRERHPCETLPHCSDQSDRLAVLRADVDDTPGIERVIADNRFGAAMFAADGKLLATVDGPGCRRWPDAVSGNTSITLSARQLTAARHRQLIMRTRNVGHCGEFRNAIAYERRGAQLAVIVDIDEGGVQGCGLGESRIRTTTTVPAAGEIVVHYEGATRGGDDAPWKPVRDRCTLHVGADGRFRALDDESRERCPQPFD